MALRKTSVQLTDEQLEYLWSWRDGMTFSEALRFLIDCEMRFEEYRAVQVMKFKPSAEPDKLYLPKPKSIKPTPHYPESDKDRAKRLERQRRIARAE